MWIITQYGNSEVFVVDYVEPATNAPFHIEDDDLKMMDNDERMAVSCRNSIIILPIHFTYHLQSFGYQLLSHVTFQTTF